MAVFLKTSGISHKIEEIIIQSKKILVLVSPYLQLSKTLVERLKDAEKNGVSIIIVFGKEAPKPNEIILLGGLNYLSLYYLENLHAKCYFNENELVLTSMNLYDFSSKNNREMGVYFTCDQDKDIMDQIKAEVRSIINSSEKISRKELQEAVQKLSAMGFSASKTPAQSPTPQKKNPKKGFCIRCEESIPHNPERPLCYDCFSTWAIYEDPYYEEDFCHTCGELDETSMTKPQCYKCFKAMN